MAVIAVHTFLYKQVQLLRVGIQKWSQIKQLASAAQAQIALSFKQLRLKFTSQQATLLCIWQILNRQTQLHVEKKIEN